MSSPRRILFVSHSASRNGATILLLHFLRWLQANSDYQMEILLLGGGELSGEFSAIGPTTTLRNLKGPSEALRLGRLGTWLNRTDLRIRMLRRSFDMVYVNTSVAAPFIPYLSTLAPALLWHIHELEYVFRLTTTAAERAKAVAKTKRFVAVSQAVRTYLNGSLAVDSRLIDLVHGFSPLQIAEGETAGGAKVRQQLLWDPDCFVVGGCGALGWRKGTDLFIQVAADLLRRPGQERTRFLWVGGGSPDEVARFAHDVKSLELGDRCRHIPTQTAMPDLYQAMNVFALTSREDPFPLVLLEAGAHRLPIVHFEKSGGAEEFVTPDTGLSAPYLEIGRFADRLQSLQQSPALCHKIGSAAAALVEQSYRLAVQGPKLQASIEHCLTARRSADDALLCKSLEPGS